MKNRVKVTMPIFNLELLDSEKKEKIIAEYFDNDSTKLELYMGKVKSQLQKNKSGNSKTYNYLNKTGLVSQFSTEKIYTDALSIGKKISDSLVKVEEKYSLFETGYKHLDNVLEKHKDEVFDSSIIDYCIKLFEKKYQYSPYYDYDDNGIELYKFFYHIYELQSLFLSYVLYENNANNNGIVKRYYDDLDNYESVLNEFLNEYQEHENVIFYLIYNPAALNSNKEYFEISMCTENFYTPVLFELKNNLSSLKTNKKYALCKNCYNIFKVKRKGNRFCYDKNCKKERDKNRKH